MEKEGSGGIGGSGGVITTSGAGGARTGVGAFAQETGTSRHIISSSPITIISFFLTLAS